MFLNVVVEYVFVIDEATLEQVNHKNYSLENKLRYLLILIAGHKLEKFVQNLIMKEDLIIGILELFELLEYSFHLVLMHIGLFDQQKIVDVSIVGKFV